MKKRKFKKDSRAYLLIGTLFCVISFAVSLLIFSLVLTFFENPIALIAPFALLAFTVSAAVPSFLNAKRKGEGGFLSAFLSSLLACAVFFSVALITSHGKISLSLLMNILCYILVSSLFAKLAGIKKKRHSRFRH